MNAEELPKVSICMPIYNRNNFKPLILNNLLGLDYPRDKLEFCIDDDGTEPFFYNNQEQEILKKLIHPIKLNYYYRKHKRTIGAKRNNLVKIASHKNYSCVGSNQMIFLYPHHNWTCHAIRCASKRQIHEACMLFTKKHWSSMGGFKSTSQGEGSKMADFKKKNVGLLEINKCMACICHNDNTINKDMFMKEDNEIPGNVSEECKNMVNKILNISP